MLKTLWLQAKGLVRQAINDNTDLRVAGNEHIHNINQSIEDVRAQRNRLAGSHLLLVKKMQEEEQRLETAKAAVRHWNTANDKDKEDRAYKHYQTSFKTLEDLKKQEANLANNIDKLDQDIVTLESETTKAKSQIDIAAGTQQAGRAKTSVEAIHTNISKGPLAGVIESAELLEATAEATQAERKSRDDSDVLDINTNGPLSREDLLK